MPFGGRSSAGGKMAEKKILVIDDEELVLKSIQTLLRRTGYEVIVSRNGQEALSVIKELQIDLIVCDVRMPSFSGIETIKAIRSFLLSEQKNLIPEILITGYAEESFNKQIEELNVAEYMYKPFDLRDFLASVKKNLGE